MSGLYTSLFGESEFGEELLDMIGLDKCKFIRFRDAYAKDGRVIVYTRNGDREGKIGEFMKEIKNHPGYVSDSNDSYDHTYAYITFSVDSKHDDRLAKIQELQGPVETVEHKFKNLEFNDMENNPRLKATTEMFRDILLKIQES